METILGLIRWAFDFIRKILSGLLDKFQEINLFEKGVVLMVIPAFLAIVLPVAKHYLFEEYFYVNNPLAHYLIGIVIVMFAAIYFPVKWLFVAREILNALYLFGFIYLHQWQGIVKTSYALMPGYYFNLAVPALYMILSFLSYQFGGEN